MHAVVLQRKVEFDFIKTGETEACEESAPGFSPGKGWSRGSQWLSLTGNLEVLQFPAPAVMPPLTSQRPPPNPAIPRELDLNIHS